MNKKFTSFVAAILIATTINAQELIKAEAAMGTGYANDVYFKLEDKTAITSTRDWDISFYRKSEFKTGIRVNDTKISKVYEVSDNFDDWDNVTIDGLSTLPTLYNSDTVWEEGAFNQASAQSGWGNYNSISHVVEGKIIFILEYTAGGYVKFKINSLKIGTYDFTYSKYVNGAWGEDKTFSLSKDSSLNRIFNYFNITTDSVVTPEPESSQWDLKFTQYTTDYPMGNEYVKYLVTGPLQSDNILVAEIEGDNNPKNATEYKSDINTIGYDWKKLNGFSYILRDVSYFVKNISSNKIYKLEFNAIPSSSVGTLSFEYKDVTASLATNDIEKTKFGIYTDVNQPKTISIIYNSQEASSSNIAVAIYSINGQLVHQENYKPTGSFTNKSINLSRLSAGVYIVKLQSGGKTESKKVVLR
ncbi:T9SS type A sorting domain-containing protein [Chishuiella sp.]|uniref:T9SS type A sorting domain-containing protein n=1 Tax=Chishuiella sp. TaxID=1969467 RepID=UPI0028A9A0F0|nr:T9SS type A sorting domain-containing protein [Chishuiella sp.]